jgi:hypothetical protein
MNCLLLIATESLPASVCSPDVLLCLSSARIRRFCLSVRLADCHTQPRRAGSPIDSVLDAGDGRLLPVCAEHLADARLSYPSLQKLVRSWAPALHSTMLVLLRSTRGARCRRMNIPSSPFGMPQDGGWCGPPGLSGNC